MCCFLQVQLCTRGSLQTSSKIEETHIRLQIESQVRLLNDGHHNLCGMRGRWGTLVRFFWVVCDNVLYVMFEGEFLEKSQFGKTTSDVQESALNIPITKPSETFELSMHSHQSFHESTLMPKYLDKYIFRIVEEMVHDIMTKMENTSTSTLSSSLFQFFFPKSF